METIHHHERFMRRTEEPAGDSQFRELTARISGRLHDLRGDGWAHCLRPDHWAEPQALAASLRAAGGDGIVYPSVRWPAGSAAALFWPDRIHLPILQSRTLQYHWDGQRVTRYFIIGEADWYAAPSP